LRASFLNLSISRIMRQKLGLIALLFCAKRPEMPLRLPHSHLLPLVPNRVLTEKDMSDISISTPSPSNHSSMFGYVTLEAEVDTICGSPLVGTVPQAFLLDQSTSLAVVSGDMYALKRTDHGHPP